MVLNTTDPAEIVAAMTRLEQDLLAAGWRPVRMTDPATGRPMTGWFPPGAESYPSGCQMVGDGDPFMGDDY